MVLYGVENTPAEVRLCAAAQKRAMFKTDMISRQYVKNGRKITPVF